MAAATTTPTTALASAKAGWLNTPTHARLKKLWRSNVRSRPMRVEKLAALCTARNKVYVLPDTSGAPSRSQILKKNLTENQALDHEKYMIFVLGRKFEGGILHNSSEGGETGPTNPSPETREKMGIWQRGIPKPSSSVEKMRSSLRSLPKPRWYHKDSHNIFIRDGNPPEGYVPGRVHTKKDWGPSDRGERVWWNNGKNESWRVESPGEGWERGRKKGQKSKRKTK